MSQLEQLIEQLCPRGLKNVRLGDVVEFQRGTSITKDQTTPGEIPVIAGGKKPAYFHGTSNRSGTTIVIAGSGAYAGFVSIWDEPIWVSDAFSVAPKSESLLTKYLFHYLQSDQDKVYDLKKGGGVPHVYGKDVAMLTIQVPPLEVQQEIVRILDTFTELEIELETELEARKKQYEHYRNTLLGFPEREGVRWVPMGDLVTTVRPKEVVPRSKYQEAGSIPVIDQGQQFISAWTDSSDSVLPRHEYVLFGDHTRSVKFVDFEFAQGADGLQILRPIHGISCKYLYHSISNARIPNRGYNRHWSIVKEMEIPVPNLDIQNEIVEVLDKFEALVNDINIGLPAELAARRKQYEHYRDKLLTFKELEA